MPEIINSMGFVLVSLSVFYFIKTGKEVFVLWMNRRKLDDMAALEKRLVSLEAQVNALQLGKSYERF